MTPADDPNSSNAETAGPKRTRRWTTWEPAIDSAIVAILAVASLAAAWSAYQANLWNGEQSAKYAQASSLRIQSASQTALAHQLTIIDVTTFTNFVNAYAQGNTKLADFYVARFRPAFLPAFNAWIATSPLTNADAPPSPFAMAEYALPESAKADQLEADAGDTFAEGQKDNDRSDDYVLNTVILATVLFFCGIAPRVRWIPARMALVAIACVLLVVGLFNVATYPIA
ncbi:MAG TPA: hypothetical protein VH482_34165 [Thermomicrobiales bacterium]|jgi:hypothetical protein